MKIYNCRPIHFWKGKFTKIQWWYWFFTTIIIYQKGMKTLLLITEYNTKGIVIHYEGYELSLNFYNYTFMLWSSSVSTGVEISISYQGSFGPWLLYFEGSHNLLLSSQVLILRVRMQFFGSLARGPAYFNPCVSTFRSLMYFTSLSIAGAYTGIFRGGH